LTPLDSKDYLVKIEEPENEEIEEDGEWFEPDDEIEEEAPSTGGLIGRREETISTGFIVGKKEETVETGKTLGGNTTGKTLGNEGKTLGGNTTGNTLGGGTTDGKKCELCGTSVPPNRYDMHLVHCKKRFGNK
jgi:hypothetical protein